MAQNTSPLMAGVVELNMILFVEVRAVLSKRLYEIHVIFSVLDNENDLFDGNATDSNRRLVDGWMSEYS